MLLRGARLATLDPPRVEAVDLRVENGRIAERGTALAARPAEECHVLSGRLVVPGLVNAHTHLYSVLARGMPGPAQPPRSFVEVLQRVWWRLDRALDEESVLLSGLAGAVEAALSGTTLLIDHHASPGFVRGSLGVLRRAVEQVGLRSVLCYEVTDRGGAEGRDAGIEENVDFARAGTSELTRALIGAHASFTLSEESLARLAETVRRTGAGFHIHVAEDRADVTDCRDRHGLGVVERLDRHGLLGPRTLLAHGIHLEAPEIERANRSGAWFVTNPRSNMNNRVGTAPTAAFERAALGTDGIDADMLAEARAGFLAMREAGRDDAFAAAIGLLAGGQRLASELHGIPFGSLGPGAPADLVVLDYDAPTPVTGANLAGHLLFGLDRSHVESVMVAGRWVVRERRVVTLDAGEVRRRAREAAAALWRRMGQVP